MVICGSDPIKTAFADRPAERDRLMRAYGDRTFLYAYDELARALCARLALTERAFEQLAERLFENYWSTWKQLHPNAQRPAERWFAKLTPPGYN